MTVVRRLLTTRCSSVAQAVFRKILSAAKGKHRSANINYDEVGPSTAAAAAAAAVRDEDFERRKQQWQGELEEMSEFLLIKSAQEQRDEGVEHPVDTAYIDDRDGMPMLKAVFDVHHFQAGGGLRVGERRGLSSYVRQYINYVIFIGSAAAAMANENDVICVPFHVEVS